MRITGGTLRGRLVRVPGGIIRPAMDRMRESVFASLGDLSGLSFLDLFSGSGIIALEAASRGAGYIEAVEADSLKKKTLLENVQISPVRINCRFMPVERYVKRAKRPFDLVFCDPPFPYKFKWQLLEALGGSKLMIPGSRLLLHRPREDRPEEEPAGLIKKETREYGRSAVDFFVRNEG
ncbi:MAG: RsmD family RNA methyltransferase [Spirochaetaceae bacterium]|jgi:16S rRNA (guanine(966)-N(2))-methyltransferase RsmD|nr:RsmD family RNA methyltransferase [Spirochaetaceae bacterium]